MRFWPSVRSTWLNNWPSSFFFLFFAFLWTEKRSKFIKTEKKNQANIQPSWPRAWSIKDVLLSKKIVALLRIKTCVFRKAVKKVNCVCSRINPRVSLMFSLFWLSSATFYDCATVIVQKLRALNFYSKFCFFFGARNQNGQYRADKVAPSCPLR